MTASTVTASTSITTERIVRNRPTHRGTSQESESRVVFTRHERRVQHQLNPTRLGAQIALKLLTDFGGEFEFDRFVDFVSAMDERGVINRRIVHDPVVRTASIANVITLMMEDGRLVGGREMQVGGRRATFLMLSPDERSIRMLQVRNQESKRARKQHDRDRQKKEARANGQPVPMSRRERRRQKARNDARKQAAQKKGRASAQGAARSAA